MILIVSDVHGAFDALARVAGRGRPLLVLGDLVNFIDYRTMEGMFSDVAGRDVAMAIVSLRATGEHDAARTVWREAVAGREDEVEERYHHLMVEAYRDAAGALAGSEAYVTFGNVDRPDLLEAALPEGTRFVDGEVVDVGGLSVGIVGGGVPRLGVPGEVSEEEMEEKLELVAGCDILCTHVAPAVRQLSHDVIGGAPKGSQAVHDHLLRHRPRWHYFGDIHQPQAVSWRVARTSCRNVGYFRATQRPVVHE